jgi:hypothetical protein
LEKISAGMKSAEIHQRQRETLVQKGRVRGVGEVWNSIEWPGLYPRAVGSLAWWQVLIFEIKVKDKLGLAQHYFPTNLNC